MSVKNILCKLYRKLSKYGKKKVYSKKKKKKWKVKKKFPSDKYENHECKVLHTIFYTTRLFS